MDKKEHRRSNRQDGNHDRGEYRRGYETALALFEAGARNARVQGSERNAQVLEGTCVLREARESRNCHSEPC